MAMACLRLFTVPPFPPRPDFRVPFFSRCMALFTLLLAACPYLRPPDFREPFFFAAMKFLLLQFRHEIATQGCRESGAEPEGRSTHFLDSRNERQRISPTQSSETLAPRDEIFRMKQPREFLRTAAISSAASVTPSAWARQQRPHSLRRMAP